MDDNEIGGVWRTIGGRRIFIKNGQDLKSAMKESGKFSNVNPVYNLEIKANCSDNFKNNIDGKIQEKVIEYTQEIANDYSDILLQDKIIWKTYTIGEKQIANSAYNLNPKYFQNIKDAKKFIRNKMKEGEYVICDDELKYVVAHEIGHNISTGLYNRLNENTFRTPKKYEKWNNEFMKRVEKRYKEEISKKLDYKKEISNYATYNKKRVEMFAECFAEYISSSNPRPFAKIFGEELEKERKLIK